MLIDLEGYLIENSTLDFVMMSRGVLRKIMSSDRVLLVIKSWIIIYWISRQICFVTWRHSSVEIVGPKTINHRSISHITGLQDVNEIMHNIGINEYIRCFYFRSHDLLRRCFSLCLQWLKNSDRRFRVASPGLNIMKNFSIAHNLQYPVVGLNAVFVSHRILQSKV